MIITLIIYVLIIGYIILKAFYTSIFIKFSNNNQKIEKFSDSINYVSMPFYINMPKIYLLCIFVNIILISLIFLPNIMNDLILLISNSNITYCQDYISDEESSSDDGGGLGMPIDRNSAFIYHINSDNINIQNYLKAFQGFSQNFEDILNKQKVLIKEISSIDKNSYFLFDIKKMYLGIHQKSMDTLKLTFTAYDKMVSSYNKSNSFTHYPDNLLFKILNNKTKSYTYMNLMIRDFLVDYQLDNLNKKATNLFDALGEVQVKSKEIYNVLDQQAGHLIINNNIPTIEEIKIPEENKVKTFKELHDYYNSKLSNKQENLIRKENIYKNINDFHKDYYYEKHLIQCIIDKGFILKEKPKFFDIEEYELFNIDRVQSETENIDFDLLANLDIDEDD